MPVDGYKENDVVRVTRAQQGKDPYLGYPVSVPSDATGTVVRGFPGDSSYDVEFNIPGQGSTYSSSVLIVPAEDLTLVERWS
ncbi:MAG: hypothetical protein FWG04_02660 [Desulfovibrionaceae bacterium]|nr:hypothetical protein [Desulfovibrionaceae bacterium]